MRNWHFSSFYFFYFATVGVIVPYWSLYLEFRGFNATEIGQLMAILLITKVLAPNIWASIADHIVARKGSSLGILKYAMLAALSIYCMTHIAANFWLMALAMLGFCVFWNACLPQLEAATLNHLGNQKDQYGLIRLWGSVGFIVTVLGLGWVMDFTGPGAIMPAGLLALICLLLASLVMRDGNQKPSAAHRITVPLKQLLNPKVVTLLLLCVFMQISHAPFYTFFSLYLKSYQYSSLHIGWLWSIGVIFEILVFIVGFKILRHYRLSSLLTFTFLVAAIRWSLVAWLPDNVAVIWLTQIMHAITYGLYHSVMIQLVVRLFLGRYQIRGQALYNSVTFGLGGAVGSFASGYIWTLYGGRFLFLIVGVMMLLVFLFSLLFTARITAQTSP